LLKSNICIQGEIFLYVDTKKRVIINGTAKQIADAIFLIEDKVQEDRQIQVKAETSILNRAPRVKSSPVKTLSDNSSIDVEYTNKIFGYKSMYNF
jgi:hypothetical protein